MNQRAVTTPLRAVELVLLGCFALTVVYFYGVLPLYGKNPLPIWQWAWMRFLPEYNQEHSKFIPLISLFLLWHRRKDIAAAPKEGSNAGLIPVVAGILLYLIAARALQARIALFALPVLLSGAVLFLWGKEAARVTLFPIALLLFMIPLGAIEQMTFRLQFLIIGLVKILSAACGISLYAVGTSLHPVSGNWGFDIAEGCSGVRSLIAMIMLTSVYVYLREIPLWKKLTILSFSVLFAVIGNAVRVFTIILLARFGHAGFAGGLYHDWSGQLIFFPVALLSMIGLARVLDLLVPNQPKRVETVA